MARLVVLERDGVLLEPVAPAIRHPGEMRLLPGAGAALARLNRAGTLVAVLTRQPLLGRGPLDEAMLLRQHEQLRDLLAPAGARLDHIGHVGGATGRDPGPAAAPALRELLRLLRVAPDDAVFIGHCLDDLQAASAAGVARILVRSGQGRATQGAGIPAEVMPLRLVDDIVGAVNRLLGVEGGEGRA
ncbi:HAD hydrolase-like protein [Zavarzinia aquatilis]|uniref:D-glycero-beta-D-manno-heptose-1,7-bisphosphate 7-phosphatase n=1 Tax=Zavarzinia aquatilis TaxID=2211142 RepID=A0A317EI59_9PROT|nr:HAD hydrolase-like protein [Zavarzinia aquatilis]PWR25113.1 D-glycero-beta-D-manno-heptose-1,7-bisphosphate 7-phosphatase [Zavarzinia aquatilis]